MTGQDDEASKPGEDESKDRAAEAEEPKGDDVAEAPEAEAPVAKAIVATRPRAAWGDPLYRLELAWTRLETRLCAVVLMAEIAALCLWISLKGLSAEYGGGDRSGLVFRALFGAVVLGYAAHKATRPKAEGEADPKAEQTHAIAVSIAVVVGMVGAYGWANRGTEYFSNVLNWMQNASSLTLVGGLRGVATRLTLWLALLGASLATAQGKHINVDVVMRFLTPKLRVPVAVLGWVAASVMCLAGVWGFFDHIAIESFHAPAMQPCDGDATKTCDAPPSKKLEKVEHALGEDLFLLGKQISLDVHSIPKVIGGTKYSEYMRTKDWNAFIGDPSWKEHFSPEDVEGLKLPEDQDQGHLPIISLPGSSENIPGLFIKDLNFIFPLGLLMIALRFLLRSALAISGHVIVDPDAAHGEPEVDEAQHEQHRKKAAAGGAS